MSESEPDHEEPNIVRRKIEDLEPLEVLSCLHNWRKLEVTENSSKQNWAFRSIEGRYRHLTEFKQMIIMRTTGLSSNGFGVLFEDYGRMANKRGESCDWFDIRNVIGYEYFPDEGRVRFFNEKGEEIVISGSQHLVQKFDHGELADVGHTCSDFPSAE